MEGSNLILGTQASGLLAVLFERTLGERLRP
jgi:hypothetical protein